MLLQRAALLLDRLLYEKKSVGAAGMRLRP